MLIELAGRCAPFSRTKRRFQVAPKSLHVVRHFPKRNDPSKLSIKVSPSRWSLRAFYVVYRTYAYATPTRWNVKIILLHLNWQILPIIFEWSVRSPHSEFIFFLVRKTTLHITIWFFFSCTKQLMGLIHQGWILFYKWYKSTFDFSLCILCSSITILICMFETMPWNTHHELIDHCSHVYYVTCKIYYFS